MATNSSRSPSSCGPADTATGQRPPGFRWPGSRRNRSGGGTSRPTRAVSLWPAHRSRSVIWVAFGLLRRSAETRGGRLLGPGERAGDPGRIAGVAFSARSPWEHWNTGFSDTSGRLNTNSAPRVRGRRGRPGPCGLRVVSASWYQGVTPAHHQSLDRSSIRWPVNSSCVGYGRWG